MSRKDKNTVSDPSNSGEQSHIYKKLPWVPKQKHQGIACRRGQPIIYDEIKQKINLMLTPTAIEKLTDLSQKLGISRSEVIETFLRTGSLRDPIEEPES